MNLVPPEIRAVLAANARASNEAQAAGRREPDHVPVVRFFSPVGSATWLATELDGNDILFGLADWGLGSPELGSFSLHEMESVQLPYGLRIERDVAFEAFGPLSAYARAARFAGSLLAAEAVLRARLKCGSG